MLVEAIPVLLITGGVVGLLKRQNFRERGFSFATAIMVGIVSGILGDYVLSYLQSFFPYYPDLYREFHFQLLILNAAIGAFLGIIVIHRVVGKKTRST